eukprot:6658307-Pyramimonas_sp.AAC.1
MLAAAAPVLVWGRLVSCASVRLTWCDGLLGGRVATCALRGRAVKFLLGPVEPHGCGGASFIRITGLCRRGLAGEELYRSP